MALMLICILHQDSKLDFDRDDYSPNYYNSGFVLLDFILEKVNQKSMEKDFAAFLFESEIESMQVDASTQK